jgi:AcrR family transcriptional regulator
VPATETVTLPEQRAPGRRDRRKQRTRDALIAAALSLVDERGLDRVTVDEISEAAGVSARTFFNYFAGKAEALIGDPLIGARDLRERLRAVPAELPVISALLLALEPAIDQIQSDRQLWLTRLRVIEANPGLLPALLARGADAEQEFIAAVAERTDAPADSAYPQVTAAAVGAVFRTAMRRWAADGERLLSGFVQEAFDLLASGLAGPTHKEN